MSRTPAEDLAVRLKMPMATDKERRRSLMRAVAILDRPEAVDAYHELLTVHARREKLEQQAAAARQQEVVLFRRLIDDLGEEQATVARAVGRSSTAVLLALDPDRYAKKPDPHQNV